MADLTENLPVELLAEILGHASVPDILRFKMVNRAFHNATLFSPLIQHKIDLYSTGLEYNAAAEVSLADSQKALLQYRSSLDSSRPSEKWTVDGIKNVKVFRRSAGGVCAILEEDSVRLLALGSPSRGIPFKEWKIPPPAGGVNDYCLYPGADVIAFLNVDHSTHLQFEIHLRTLSDGKHHPAAQYSTIQHWVLADMLGSIHSVSISGSRFVVLADVWGNISAPKSEVYLAIWDWKSGQILFEVSGGRYSTVEFLDDYRLLATLHITKDLLPPLAVIDTSKDAAGIPIQTFFRLPPDPGCFGTPYQISEQGAHNSPHQDSLIPFHHDPTQRIVVLSSYSNHLIFQTEELLKLVECREGSEIGWDEWKNNAVVVSSGFGLVGAWVSGCRFFGICEDEDTGDAKIIMYDFGAQRISTYLKGTGDPLPNGAGVEIPWNGLGDHHIGHDCFVFTRRHREEGGPEGQSTLHIWALS